MPNALFSFDDRIAARRAADALIADGLPSTCVEIHQHEEGPNDKVLGDIDEVITGGMAHSFSTLFQGLFDWGGSPHEPSDYKAVISRGGAVVSVTAADDARQRAVDSAMASAGVAQRTGWSTPPRELNEARERDA